MATDLRAEPGSEAKAVEWNPAWHRVRTWEYVAGPAVLAGAFALRFAGPQPERTWQGGILFDDAVIDAIAVRGDARGAVKTTTDVAYIGAMAFRLVDSTLLPGLMHGSWDVALQMTFIDIEAFSVVAAVLWGTQVFVGRERPYVAVCRADPEYAAREADCKPSSDWNRSFISGHPAVGVTAAALTCLHHTHLRLYGGVGDGLACGLSIAAAAANGLGRVIAEKHYSSDLILGVGLGLLAGYVVPKTLHYGWGARSEPSGAPTSRREGVHVVVLPMITRDTIGLSLAGAL